MQHLKHTTHLELGIPTVKHKKALPEDKHGLKFWKSDMVQTGFNNDKISRVDQEQNGMVYKGERVTKVRAVTWKKEEKSC